MNVKKLISMVLALVMLLAMSATVFAEDAGAGDNTNSATTYSITINNTADGHTYEAYQIFSGTLKTESVTNPETGKTELKSYLGNIQWGSGVANKEGLTLLGDAVTIAESLKSVALAEEFAKDIEAYLTTPAGSDNTKSTDDKYVISGLEPGYYLVKDQDDSLDGDDDSYTSFILVVVKDVDVEPKSDKPSFEKKVDDKNDSNTTQDAVKWEDSADYDIGDAVPFQLTATLPENYSAYTRYKLVFHDTMTKMENVQITDVYLANQNGGKIASFTVNEEEEIEDYVLNEAEGSFTVTFANLKTSSIAAQILDSYKIVVEYTAVLSDSANIGATGNPNTAYLEFSNNPNYTGNGDNEPTGNTPVDKVIVFTYKVIVNKVDPDKKPLDGAEFTLSKKLADGSWKTLTKVTGTAGTTFEWKGLDDGDYKLEETKTPDGYNKVDDILFTITATHDTESDNPALTDLSGNVASGEVTFTADTGAGSLTTSVVNQKGAELPETGAQGTKMLYIVGGILVAAAVVLLIVKRRMDSAE